MDGRELVRRRLDALAVRVDEDLEHLREALAAEAGHRRSAPVGDGAPDALDAALTEACCALLVGSTPTEDDVRCVVAVAGIAAELDHIGTLARRVAERAGSGDGQLGEGGQAVDPACQDILQVMADEAVDRYRGVLRAWSAADGALAAELTRPSGALEVAASTLAARLVDLRGRRGAGTAQRVEGTARALDRIVEHTHALATRLRPLLALEAGHLAARAR